jgi:hypothetical protein
MKSIKKLLLFIALIFAAFISAWFYLFKVIDNPPNPSLEETISLSPTVTLDNQKSVTVTFNFPQGTSTYNYEFEGDTSAFEATKAVLDRENIPYETKQYDFGVFVQSINEYESSENNAWIYFVNGESANVGVDAYILSNGDSIEWQYIKPTNQQ